jgi:hypothetical protein
MLILLIILLATWFYFKNNCTCKKNKIKEGFNSDTINYCKVPQNNIEITIQELNNHIKKVNEEDQKNIFHVVEKLIDENASKYRTDNLSNLEIANSKNQSIENMQENMKTMCETIYKNDDNKKNICEVI